jgi:hypothetical protein
MQYLLRLAGSLGLGLQVGRGRTTREETGEQWLDEGVEDDLGAAELRKGHPENKGELEDVVEREPVGGIDSALNDSQESVHNPVSQPLSIISCTRSKQGMKRVITRDQETGKINQELASDVEEDEEKVDADKTEDGVDLGDGGLSFEVVEEGVFGELLVKLRNLMLRTILKAGHIDGSIWFQKFD